MKEYSVYKGDTFVMTGTAKECAKGLNKSVNYIYWLGTPAAKSRGVVGGLSVVRLGDEREYYKRVPFRTRKLWTDEEHQILSKIYLDYSDAKLAEIFGATEKAIIGKRLKLGLNKYGRD